MSEAESIRDIPAIVVCDPNCLSADKLHNINRHNEDHVMLTRQYAILKQQTQVVDSPNTPAVIAEAQETIDEATALIADETIRIDIVNAYVCQLGGPCVRNAAYILLGGGVPYGPQYPNTED